MHSFLKLFFVYSAIVVLIPVIAGIMRFKKLEHPIQYLAILVFADFSAEVITHIFYLLKLNNHFVWPFFISIEYGLIVWIYCFSLKPVLLAKVFIASIPIFTCFVFLNWIASGRIGLSVVPRFIESVVVLFLVLSFFYSTLKNLTTTHLERQPMFWLSTGLFIYFSGDIIIFIFSNYMLSYSEQFNTEVWFIHSILNIILYIFYTLAICTTPKKLN
jgi:hypothetical protein